MTSETWYEARIFAELADDAIELLKKAGHAIVTFVVAEEQKAVVVLKQHDTIVTKAMNLISDLEDSSHDGTARMDKVIGDLSDDYDAFTTAGGFEGILESGVNVLRQFAQSVFDDFKAAL